MLINCTSYLGDYTNLCDQDNSFYCQDIRKFPVAQSEFFINQGVKATIQCAFKDGEMITGLVRFDECIGRRFWTKRGSQHVILNFKYTGCYIVSK